MQLSEEQKRDYKKKGEDFIRQARIINEKVLRLEVKESELAKMIANNIPKTPRGVGFCYNCNVESMVPSGYRNYPGTRNRNLCEPIYKCEICGYVDVKPVLMIPVLVRL